MRIMIAYDPEGNIVNVARVRNLPENIPHPFGDLTEGDRVLSIEEPSEELLEISLTDILSHFRVDVETKSLVAQE